MVSATPLRAASPESPIDAQAIVAGLERAPPARTAFTEVRYSGLLERPLILHGELEYLGPGRLGRRVDQPYQEQTTIADGSATVRRGERAPRTFSLGQAPELEGFLRGFSALLGGDADGLRRDFTLSASGDAANWRLQLKPRDSRLARRVRAIDVDGAHGTPRCFRTQEGDDDLVILLVDTLAATPLGARPGRSELDALCRGAKAR